MNIVLCGHRNGFDTTNHQTNKMCEEISVRKESWLRSAQIMLNYQILCYVEILDIFIYLLLKATIPK
jgi:hypothetical protein